MEDNRPEVKSPVKEILIETNRTIKKRLTDILLVILVIEVPVRLISYLLAMNPNLQTSLITGLVGQLILAIVSSIATIAFVIIVQEIFQESHSPVSRIFERSIRYLPAMITTSLLLFAIFFGLMTIPATILVLIFPQAGLIMTFLIMIFFLFISFLLVPVLVIHGTKNLMAIQGSFILIRRHMRTILPLFLLSIVPIVILTLWTLFAQFEIRTGVQILNQIINVAFRTYFTVVGALIVYRYRQDEKSIEPPSNPEA